MNKKYVAYDKKSGFRYTYSRLETIELLTHFNQQNDVISVCLVLIEKVLYYFFFTISRKSCYFLTLFLLELSNFNKVVLQIFLIIF